MLSSSAMRLLLAVIGTSVLASAQGSTYLSSSYTSTLPAVISGQATTAHASSIAAASSAASTTVTGPVTHTVNVGQNGFTFVPQVIQASVGDYIQFDFFPFNHSVVRSEYMYPCIPYEDTGVNRVGFFSGFKPVDTILADPPKFTIRVNDTNPIFFYCSAPGACIDDGMVGGANLLETQTIAVQEAYAKNSTFMLQPGQAWPAEDPNPFSSTSATSSPTAAPAATSSAPASSTATKSSGLSTGAIAGIAIGGAAVVLVAATLLYMCGRNSRRRDPAAAHQGSQNYPQQGSHVSYVSQAPDKSFSPMGRVMLETNTPRSPELPGYVPVPLSPPLSPPLHSPYTTTSHEGYNPVFSNDSRGSFHGASPLPHQTSFMGTHPAAAPAPSYQHNIVHEMPAGTPLETQAGAMGYSNRTPEKMADGVERYG